jgi:hypothetical protein
MTIIVLMPALLCVITLCLWPDEKVFRNIVLPVVLLCPLIYLWKVALLPPIDFSDAVLLPLGVAMVLRSLRGWQFSLIDLWIALFVFSTFWADHTLGRSTTSIFELFDAVCTTLIPYMAGKLLIEGHDGRIPVVRRIVTLLVGISLVASIEFFAAVNPWERLFSQSFPHDLFDWTRQFRGGHARITGPFWQAELAGTMLMLGVILALWLARYAEGGQRFRSARWFPFRKSTIFVATLVIGIFLTQSRGPELGLLFAVPIALIGRSRRVLRSTLLTMFFLALAGTTSYLAISNYAASRAPSSEEQQTAQYRAIMIKHYLPLAEHSGAWGFGPLFPTFSIYKSIDNEYLYVALVQGWVGLGTFLLASAGTLYHLVWGAIYHREKEDRAFAFTLLGAFLGFLVILATVFLGYQPHIFFFLIVGWAQALKRPVEKQAGLGLQQIYT